MWKNPPIISESESAAQPPPADTHKPPGCNDLERGLSRFELHGKLGDGAMGVVYAGVDLRSGRKVAIKFLPPHLAASADMLERLRREGRAIASLNHPNVETIYEFDEVDGRPFLVLEYLPGGTLRQKIAKVRARGQFLPYHKVLTYAIQAAEGLAHAHRHGVLHRDIKPGNLMFTEEGKLKITDFGLAKLRDADPEQPTDQPLGTVVYLSPEQAQGAQADERSDVYSLGVVLFEMLTGTVPFVGSSAAGTLFQIAHEPAPSLREFREDAPGGFVAILDRALRKKPSDRYQSVQELLRDLHELEREVEAVAARDTQTVSVKPAAARFPYAIAVAAGMVILLASLYAGGVILPPSQTGQASTVPWLPGPPPHVRLVVLPCRNHGVQADAAICAGLLDILTTRLTESQQLPGQLRIFPQGVVEGMKIGDPAQARHRLSATHAIEVSLTRLEGRYAFSVKLIKTDTCEILGGRTLELRPEELAGLNEELVNVVISLLGPRPR